MPHITLQYTNNISNKKNFNRLFAGIHTVLSKRAEIDPRNCKSRAIKLTDYFIGEGEKSNAFVHLELRIFQGRNSEIKQQIGKEILKLLKTHFKENSENLKIQFTVEIIEMDGELYFKS
jgi:5-carboxymethyl-2-hydroxymuconate isomerase